MARVIRDAKGLALEDVSVATGIRVSPLSRFERGLGSLGLGKLKVLAQFYNTSVDTLIMDVPLESVRPRRYLGPRRLRQVHLAETAGKPVHDL